ncbi:hypothetical protein [Aquipuribacter nitratireducens]|uniref:Tryptophan-rich sensory protein n=1 Tax=Aquipuribacter nitratireducens TaxID=650104 RepID=A0ABW0GNQ4_9MICO
MTEPAADLAATPDVPAGPADAPPRRTTGDLARAVAVVVTAVAQVAGSPLGTALAGGTSVADVSDRYATVVTPAGYAFAVWGLIFTACAAWAVYQTLPAQLPRDVHRRTGWWLAAAFAANTAWELVFPQDGTAVLVAQVLIVVVVVTAAVAAARLQAPPPHGLDRLLPGVVAPLLLGWVTFATVANTAISGVYLGAPQEGALARGAGIVALVAAAAVVLDVGLRLRSGTLPFVGAAAWGAAGVAAADPAPVVTAAAWFAVVVMLAAVPVQLWRTRDPGRTLLA